MSIFDVIKYPITEDFLFEDIERIPSQAINSWWYEDIMKIKVFRNMAIGYSSHIDDIYDMMLFMPEEQIRYRPALCKLLRKRIEQL